MARFGALLIILALGACKPAATQQLDPNAEVIARQFYEEVKSGADLNADVHMARELKNPTSEQQLAMFLSMIPHETARSIDLESWDAKTDDTGTTTRPTIDYGYSDRTPVAQTALFKSPSGKDPVIVGFQITSKPPASCEKNPRVRTASGEGGADRALPRALDRARFVGRASGLAFIRAFSPPAGGGAFELHDDVVD